MSEHSEQALVISWANRLQDTYPELRWLHSSLNGIYIPAPRPVVSRIINHMKAEGMKKGIPDLFLPVARHGYHGLFIEMKRDDGGAVSSEQKAFMKFAEEQGYLDKVCFGYEEAKDALEWYLK